MKFLSSARERGLAVTGTMLKTVAERQTKKAGIVGFKASDGWLGKVKARHGISGKNLSSEAGSVSVLTVQNWNAKSCPGFWLITKWRMLIIVMKPVFFGSSLLRNHSFSMATMDMREKKTNLGFHF